MNTELNNGRPLVKTDKKVLDACCGGRMMWFNQDDPRALFIDIRELGPGVFTTHPGFQVRPDMIADFRNLPFADRAFKLIAWDPPHLKHAGANSFMFKKYGSLKADCWRSVLTEGFNELWRVLDENGTLVFKWNEEDIPLKEVLLCFKERPLFGHTTSQKTHWMIFFKESKETISPVRQKGGEE